MILFDAANGQMRSKRSVLLRKPQGDHCTIDALGQRGQAIEVPAETNPQYARRPVVWKHPEPLAGNDKRRNMGDRRLHDQADPVNLALCRITEKFQVKVKIFMFTP